MMNGSDDNHRHSVTLKKKKKFYDFIRAHIYRYTAMNKFTYFHSVFNYMKLVWTDFLLIRQNKNNYTEFTF